MSTLTDHPLEEQLAQSPLDAPPVVDDRKVAREWVLVAVGLVGLVAIMAVVVAAFALAGSSGDNATTVTTAAPKAAAAAPAAAATPTLAQSKGVAFESFKWVDPTLPAPVTKVKVDVFQHVTQVSKDLAPTEIWSFAVNGKYYRGNGLSAPIVVEEGTKVDFTITNGSEKAMNVDLPHSLDYHSAEVNPGKRYADILPGKSMHYTFVAKHPGVFMYHCATQPVLMHTGAGMVGMMIVKPKGLAPVDRELFMTQQEFYIGKPGQDADMTKMEAKKPDVIAFNGFANQYKDQPIEVRKGERIRMYVLNAGPSIWSAFHVIGTVFDKTHVEGTVGRDSQTINLAPSQGGWVEFTLDEEGTFPFVTHAFGDAVKGAIGVLKTADAATAGGGHDMGGSAGSQPAAAKGDVNVELGDMFIKADKAEFKAGKVTFAVKNSGNTIHGFAVSPAPAKVDGGLVDHESLLASGKDIAGGATDTVTADLKPGQYELICHIPGHYSMQHIPFTVK